MLPKVLRRYFKVANGVTCRTWVGSLADQTPKTPITFGYISDWRELPGTQGVSANRRAANEQAYTVRFHSNCSSALGILTNPFRNLYSVSITEKKGQ